MLLILWHYLLLLWMTEKKICISTASVCRFLYPLCTAAHLRTPHCTHFLMFAAYEYLKWKSHNQLEFGKPILTLANSDMHVFIFYCKSALYISRFSIMHRCTSFSRVCCVWATELNSHAHLFAMLPHPLTAQLTLWWGVAGWAGGTTPCNVCLPEKELLCKKTEHEKLTRTRERQSQGEISD